jgi:chromosome partitioning protein
MPKIAIVSFKGGVGKSFIAHQLITSFGYKGVAHDPYGNLANRLPEKVISIKNIETLTELESNDVVFDCGGFDDKMLHGIIQMVDILVIPFNPSYESIQSTIQMLNTMKQQFGSKKLLFVSNMTRKSSLTDDAFSAFNKVTKTTVNRFIIPDYFSFQTAVNTNQSIIKMAEKQSVYKKAAECISLLHDCILHTINK